MVTEHIENEKALSEHPTDNQSEAIYCVMEALDACKFMPNVKEDDNPVIMIAKLKK